MNNLFKKPSYIPDSNSEYIFDELHDLTMEINSTIGSIHDRLGFRMKYMNFFDDISLNICLVFSRIVDKEK